MDIVAEWPGRVAEIHVAAGDSADPEDELVTIESMKMLMPVLSPVAGRVTEVCVSVDQTVSDGDVLVRIEA